MNTTVLVAGSEAIASFLRTIVTRIAACAVTIVPDPEGSAGPPVCRHAGGEPEDR